MELARPAWPWTLAWPHTAAHLLPALAIQVVCAVFGEPFGPSSSGRVAWLEVGTGYPFVDYKHFLREARAGAVFQKGCVQRALHCVLVCVLVCVSLGVGDCVLCVLVLCVCVCWCVCVCYRVWRVCGCTLMGEWMCVWAGVGSFESVYVCVFGVWSVFVWCVLYECIN
jgi:hypothetical protein